MNNNIIPIVIVGATSSGKTALSIDMALRTNGEIISADSRQVYKGLNIGTGKVTMQEMRGIPHYMLDVADPKDIFTAYQFATMASPILNNTITRKKTPIICGGTGFYIDALLRRVNIAEVQIDMESRASLAHQSAEQLFALLSRIDNVIATKKDTPSERNNIARLIRAIEIAIHNKNMPSNEISDCKHEEEIQARWIGISWDRDELRKRIDTRLDERIESGMLDEAYTLHQAGLSYERMISLGLEYRYMAMLMQNQITRDEFVERLRNAIHQYAKRQDTWWRRNKNIKWFDGASASLADDVMLCLKEMTNGNE